MHQVAFDVASGWPVLADEMTDGQFNEFALKVLTLNRSATDVPASGAETFLGAAELAPASELDLGDGTHPEPIP